MKLKRTGILLCGMLLTYQTYAQQIPPPGTPSVAKTSEKNLKKTPQKNNVKSPKLFFNAGMGIANYLGDLIKDKTAFVQPSYSFNAGLHYSISAHFNARFDIGFHNVQGYDSKNGGAHPERNLSFRSKIIEFSLAAEYTLMNMNKNKFSPYFFAGIGVFNFNPRAYYGSGGTYGLRELGTEGQGLPGYPGLYSTLAVEYPLGFGFKFKINNKIMLLAEFNYRATGTDYLDDVSNNGYPPKALLDARNPLTSKFTWRGNEVGGGSYPANLQLPRGNPNNKDGYYTTQFKVAYTFNKKAKKEKVVVPPTANKVLAKDSDEDGVTDAFDKCPLIKGTEENSGCPLPFIEGAELINITADSMTYSIYFDLDRSILLPDAYKVLKRIVEILEADNSLNINLTGHSDNLGTGLVNMNLSAERANITKDYFLSYHIAANRITSSYYGETRPADTLQQWRNRRVEITIIKK